MGCDIHQYAERLQDGVWVAEQASTLTNEAEEGEAPYFDMANSGDRGRDYHLFGLLSEGVRYDCPWAFIQKGEPEDPSPEVKHLLNSWEGDGHSHNYLTFDELAKKIMELMLIDTPESRDWMNSLKDWVDSMGPTDIDPNHRRVVFWFDN